MIADYYSEVDMNQSNSSNAFSKETFSCLKGYLAVCILIHHLHQFTGFLSDTSFGYPFLLLGHWAVVIFMFMSGYGLFTSYLAKGDSYIKSFPKKRLLPFYVTYLFFVLIYAVYELIVTGSLRPAEIVRSLTYGGTIVSFGWYFQLTLLMYIFFYVLKLLLKDDRVFLIVIGASILIFLAVNFLISSQKTVYEPAFAFYLGLIISHFQAGKEPLFTKKPLIAAFMSLGSFLLLTLAKTLMEYRCEKLMASNRAVDLAYLVLMMVSDLFLIVFVLAFATLAMRSFPRLIKNPCSRFLGTYSLEIYALQGLFLRLLNGMISNRALYSAVAVICIILCAIPVHMGIAFVKKKLIG